VDSGCFRSFSDDIHSVVDEFDVLLLQLKCLGSADLNISRPPNVQDRRHTVPYFPPVTSALRREHGMFSNPQSSCVDYVDDEALSSPQFLPMSHTGREYASSLADINCVSATDFQTLSDSFIRQICSRSCPDVSDPPAAAIPCTSTADVQQSTDVGFNGLYTHCIEITLI